MDMTRITAELEQAKLDLDDLQNDSTSADGVRPKKVDQLRSENVSLAEDSRAWKTKFEALHNDHDKLGEASEKTKVEFQRYRESH